MVQLQHGLIWHKATHTAIIDHCFVNKLSRTCSVVRQTKLLVHRYLLPLKLMGYHLLNGLYLSDGPSKSHVTSTTPGWPVLIVKDTNRPRNNYDPWFMAHINIKANTCK